MKRFILSLLLVFSVGAQAQQPVSDLMLDDLMSPDEIAEEANLPATRYQENILSVEQAYQANGNYDVTRDYPIVVRINKSAYGPNAQRLWLYEYGQLTSTYLVSTGRERWEEAKSGRRYFSVTPTGWFHPKRFVRNHWSSTWQTYMEFSIFFNGGIALHATTPPYYPLLGQRASGGCVRQTRENAEYLYNRGLAVRTAFVPMVTLTGEVARDSNGNIIRIFASNMLIIVEN